VVFTPGNMFFVDGGGERMLRLSFSALPLTQIDEGIRRLADAIPRRPAPAGAGLGGRAARGAAGLGAKPR